MFGSGCAWKTKKQNEGFVCHVPTLGSGVKGSRGPVRAAMVMRPCRARVSCQWGAGNLLAWDSEGGMIQQMAAMHFLQRTLDDGSAK